MNSLHIVEADRPYRNQKSFSSSKSRQARLNMTSHSLKSSSKSGHSFHSAAKNHKSHNKHSQTSSDHHPKPANNQSKSNLESHHQYRDLSRPSSETALRVKLLNTSTNNQKNQLNTKSPSSNAKDALRKSPKTPSAAVNKNKDKN